MAKNNEIKTKLTLEGEQQFKRAMDDAASAMKVLNSEQKLAAAEFRSTGDAETYAAERARILKEKIAEQQKVVEAAESALSDMKKLGVDPNSRAYTTMQGRVNDAKTKLIEMNTELGDVTGALETGKGKADDYSGALQTIGNGVTLQGAIDAIGRVTDAIAGIAKTAAHVMKETWDIMNGAGDWADELITTAMTYEIPVETLQRWRYAATQVDTEVSTIASAHQKIIRSMTSTSTDTAEAFNALNVATHKTDGSFRDSYDVFWDVITALGGIDDATVKDNLAMQLLGRSYAELNPLINAGREAWDSYAAAAVPVSDESVEDLGHMKDAMDTLAQVSEATKYELLASFAPTFETIAKAMTATVQAFNDFIHTEEGQAALNQVSEAVTGLITSLTEEGGMEKIVQGAADAVIALKDGLIWIVNNWNTVRRAIEILAGVFAGLKVTEGVLTFLQLMNGAKWIGNLVGKGAGRAVMKGADAVTGQGNGISLWHGLGPTLLRFGKGIFNAAKTGLTALSGTIVGAGLAGTAIAAPISYLEDTSYTERHHGEGNRMLERSDEVIAEAEAAGVAMDGMADVFQQLGEQYEIIDGTSDNVIAMLEIIKDNWDDLAQQLDMDELLDGWQIPEEIEGAHWAKAEEFVSRVYAALGKKIEQETEKANNDTSALDSAAQLTADVYEAIGEKIESDTAKATVNPADYAAQQELWQMFDLAQKSGMSANGMLNLYGGERAQELLAQVFPDWSDYFSNMQLVDESTIADRIDTIKGWLEEDMTAAGLDASTGFTTGIGDGTADAADASADMAQGIIDAAQDTLDEHSPSKVMYDIGQNVSIGLANGITSQISAAQAAAARLAAIVAQTVALRLAIHSPSKVMAEMGAFTAEGFAEGIEENIGRVQDAVGRMASATARAPEYGAFGRGQASGGQGGAGQINAVIVMDKQIVGELVAPTVDGWIGSAIREKR